MTTISRAESMVSIKEENSPTNKLSTATKLKSALKDSSIKSLSNSLKVLSSIKKGHRRRTESHGSRDEPPTFEFNETISQLSIESTIEDFREFQSGMQHPALMLDIMTTEDDKEVLTDFDTYCNELLNALADVETSIEEMSMWKNTFVMQSVPSAVKLDIVILFARLFRRYPHLTQQI